MSSPRVALPGSDRHELRPRAEAPACHPDERHEVSLITAGHLTESEIDALYGFTGSHGLVVVQHDRARRRVVLSGRTPNIESAFGVELHHRASESGTYCAHYGPVTIPGDILPLVEGVFGLDCRPVAQPHFRKLGEKTRHFAATRASNSVIETHANTVNGVVGYDYSAPVIEKADAAYHAAFKKPPGTFTPLDLARLYNFPPGDGSGQCIALIELGGGYSVKDFQAYADELGLPHFSVTWVSVDHGRNLAGGDADGEVMLDIEVAAAIAPKAKIVVYFSPNTDAGFIDAISAAVHDTVNRPSVISISWGSAEANWSKAAMNSMDKVFAEAAAKGITVLAASGDDGSSDGMSHGDHVDFPASSPHVTGVGGTTLTVHGSTITETVWNKQQLGEGSGGGGFSTHFPTPTWQAHSLPSGRTGRGVPDVAAVADPTTGYAVRVHGSDQIIGGTSASAPLVAGLVARINQATHGRLGHLCPTVYAHSVCRDIVKGDNGAFVSLPGWDACSGLGVIDGSKLFAAVHA